MTGSTIARKWHQPQQHDAVPAIWHRDRQLNMWALLGQHVHPNDIETQRAVKQNNGSISSTTSAYTRAESMCPVAERAFDALLTNTLSENLELLAQADSIAFNGLKDGLGAVDIHQDHHQRRSRKAAHSAGFAHVTEQRFKSLAQAMPRLRHIEISCANLPAEFIDGMVCGLSDVPIEVLILHHCQLGADEIALLLEHFGPSLVHLDVSYNNLWQSNLCPLPFHLSTRLSFLDVSHCNLDLADLNLTECVSLKHLNVSSNQGGSSFLMGHDFSSMPLLQSLALNRTQLVGGSLSHLDLTHSNRLNTLDLGYNALRDDDMHKFVIAPANRLRRMNVSGNAIGAVGLITLMKKGMHQLVELDFADNDLKDFARTQALHQASLRVWPELQSLDLAGCGGVTKSCILALDLGCLPKLSALDLSATQMDDETFAALPWHTMAALHTFVAEFNHITSSGIDKAALCLCPSLRVLNMHHHAMEPVEALTAFINKAPRQLSHLRLSCADLTEGPSAQEPQTLHLLQELRRTLGPGVSVQI